MAWQPASASSQGIALTASGTYNAGEGQIAGAEENFAEAFEMFAPVSRLTDTQSTQGTQHVNTGLGVSQPTLTKTESQAKATCPQR